MKKAMRQLRCSAIQPPETAPIMAPTVAQDGLIYATDYDAGLYIMQWKGE